MPTYIMLSTLTPEGVQTVKNNPQRIKEVNREIEQIGAKVLAQWAVLGQFDFVNVVEAPDEKTMAKVSLELGSRGTAHYQSLAAIPIDEFIASHARADLSSRRIPGNPDEPPAAEPTTSATGTRAGRRRSPAPTAGGRSAPTAWSTGAVGIKCPECARQPRSAIVRAEARTAPRARSRAALGGGAAMGLRHRAAAGLRPLLRADPRLADRDRHGRARAVRRAAATAAGRPAGSRSAAASGPTLFPTCSTTGSTSATWRTASAARRSWCWSRRSPATSPISGRSDR